MGWPFPYDAKPSEIRILLEQIQGKCVDYAREEFWNKVMGKHYFTQVINDLRKKTNEGIAKGDAAVGYMDQLAQIRAALRHIDTIARSGGHVVDPREAGDAFGVLFSAAGDFLASGGPLLRVYADALHSWGRDMGGVAEMLVGHNPTKRGMGVTQRQAQRARDQGWDQPDSKQFAR